MRTRLKGTLLDQGQNIWKKENGILNTFLLWKKQDRLKTLLENYNLARFFLYKDNEILDEAANFYEKLYDDNNVDTDKIAEYLNSINVENTLNENDKYNCDKEVTIEELDFAIKNLKNNKSPGMDGLTPEFFKTFWPHINILFQETAEEIFELGELTDSMNKSVLSLLYKNSPNNKREKIEHYRPLSLSNYDYKIIAFVIANRIKKIIGKIVSEDQTAYIEGRFIGCNARFLIDLIEYSDKYNEGGILLSIDFKKAFDSLNWNFMTQVLRRFNFGEKFIKMIETLYNNPKTVIKNNGHFSREISLKKGVKQGCPASALIFTLCVEFLAKAIKQNETIEGIEINKKKIKILQHADDTTLLLKNRHSIQPAIDTVEKFSKISGLFLNLEKTAGIWLGKDKTNEKIINNIHFKDEPIKCLGVYIGHDKKECEKRNWEKKLTDMKKLFESWKKRKLTIFGKITIINTLAISKLIYNFTILNVPLHIIKEINSMIYNFSWKKDFIKRTQAIGKIQNGGLGLIDIECKIQALKATWVTRLFTSKSSWKCIPIKYINDMGFEIKDFIKARDISHKDVFKNIDFYKCVFEAFVKCKDKLSKNYTNLLEELVWLNDQFIWKDNVLYFENWVKSGFLYAKDFYDMNGDFITEQNVLQKLKNKKNWIQEYFIIRSVFSKKLKDVEKIKSRYTNIQYRYNINVHGKFESILDKKSSFYYDILLLKKSTRNKCENTLCETLNLQNTRKNFAYLYSDRISRVACRKISEFNFKLLNNCIYCGYVISKWNTNVQKKCTFCKVNHTSQHLLYECVKSQEIWRIVENVIRYKIKWKHIVAGFTNSNKSSIIQDTNMMISVIAKSMHSFWAKNSENDENLRNGNLKAYICYNILVYKNMYVHLEYNKHFVNIAEKIINLLIQ